MALPVVQRYVYPNITMESRKKVLVPIVGQGSITHVIRTGMLDQLRSFCEPVVALLWHQDDLVEELRAKNYEVVFIPSYKVTPTYAALRAHINVWYINHKLKTPSVNIQKQYLAKAHKSQPPVSTRKKIKETLRKLQFNLQPGTINRLIRKEAATMQQEEVYGSYADWLASLQVSGLFTVTPFLPEVDLMARILRGQNIPIIASIHSFDNVTKRGWQAVVFDEYIVWNKYNKAELLRIHASLQSEKVTIAGAPQFDFHFNEKYTWSRSEWMQRVGIPAGKKVILYSGGSERLLPNEPQYLKALKDSFEKGIFSDDYVILFRCHPLDHIERWKKFVGESDFVVYDRPPGGMVKLDFANVLEDDIVRLMSTLKHTEMHINVVSTMAVDGSAFGKPQIGPYYDEVDPATESLFRRMYYQEHYRPIMKIDVVQLAQTKQAFIELVQKVLENPSHYTSNCIKCVEEIVTFSDGKSANRAAIAVEKFFAA